MTSIDPGLYQITAIKYGLKSVKQGFRLNRLYTPKNLRAMTEKLTGKTFKARDYDGMIAALEELADKRLEELKHDA